MKAPSNAKVVWGFSKISSMVKGYIFHSRYIDSTEKDSLIGQLEKIENTLQDAIKRENGTIPFPPSHMKKIEKARK